MSRNDPVELELYLHYETEKAFLMSENNDREHAVWLPKSQIRFHDDSVAVGESVIVIMPEWLAEAKDLY